MSMVSEVAAVGRLLYAINGLPEVGKQFPEQVKQMREEIDNWINDFPSGDLSSVSTLIERLTELKLLLDKESGRITKIRTRGYWPLYWRRMRGTLFSVAVGVAIETVTDAMYRTRVRDVLSRSEAVEALEAVEAAPVWGVSSVLSLSNDVVGCANQILQLWGNWYMATEKWKGFAAEVKRLEATVQAWEGSWENKSRDRVLASNTYLIDRLENAKSSLGEELLKLQQRASPGAGFWTRVMKTTASPLMLGSTVQSVTDEFRNITETIRMRAECSYLLERARMRMLAELCADSRYVHFEKLEAEICQALDNPEGPIVVLLYGTPGTGKSTLARSMLVHYSMRTTMQDKFYLALFLDQLGRGANAEDELFELIVRLGSIPTSPQIYEKYPEIRIRNTLKSLLARQKILVILDDVWDVECLHMIVGLGSNIGSKFLVTSQWPDLCCGLPASIKHIDIEIQDISTDNARNILASHCGLPNQEIPEHLQEVADRIIDLLESNPLAIASVASVINCDRANDLEEWEDAYTNLFKALETGSLKPEYAESVWADMENTILTLTEGARYLSLLTCACEGHSVPEEIVEILYNKTVPRGLSGLFLNSRGELANGQLIRITTDSSMPLTSRYLGMPTSRTTWSVYFMHKHYIDMEMSSERDDIITSLLGGPSMVTQTNVKSVDGGKEREDSEKKVTMAVCALYLEIEFASIAISKLGIDLDNFHARRRNAIQPITLLLARSVNGRWTSIARDFAMEVFLKYICENTLDDEGITHLLGLPIAETAMWTALKDITHLLGLPIAETEMWTALKDITRIIDSEAEVGHLVDGSRTPRLLRALVDRLAEGVESSIQHAALEVIGNLARNHRNAAVLKSFPGVLNGIAKLLSSDTPESSDSPNSPVQTMCASVIHDFASSNTSVNRSDVGKMEVQERIGTSPRHPDGLVSHRSAEGVQTLPDIFCEHIANYPGVLDGLVKALSKDNDPRLQVEAAKALRKISQEGTNYLLVVIGRYPRLIVKLVESLSKPHLEQHAANTLVNLTRANETEQSINVSIQFVEHREELSKLAEDALAVNSLSRG